MGFDFGSGCFRAASSPSPSPPRGGVREERFGGGAPFFGMSWRVISPWPTVHRFVVTQYRTSPTGKWAMKKTKKTGMTMNRIRCVLSTVADMYSVDAIWLAT